MQVEKVATGLWRWTGRLTTGEDVASIYLEEGGYVHLFDPIIPPEDANRFLSALDLDVERFGGRGEIHLTSSRHIRDAELLEARYPGMRRPEGPGTDDITPISAGNEETAYVLVRHAAAVVGDALVGHNGVLRYGAEPRPELVRALVESRVERILVSHGEPVLGGEALRALLAV